MSALFIILVGLTRFSEKCLFLVDVHGFMSNLIKKSWTDSTTAASSSLFVGQDLWFVKRYLLRIDATWLLRAALVSINLLIQYYIKSGWISEGIFNFVSPSEKVLLSPILNSWGILISYYLWEDKKILPSEINPKATFKGPFFILLWNPNFFSMV